MSRPVSAYPLFPTKHRKAFLRAVDERARVVVFTSTHEAWDNKASVQVTARLREAFGAGWVEPIPEEDLWPGAEPKPAFPTTGSRMPAAESSRRSAMASGPQHYQMAEYILDEAKKFMAESVAEADAADLADIAAQHGAMVAQAAAHATLALVAATAELDLYPGPNGTDGTGRTDQQVNAWDAAFGVTK